MSRVLINHEAIAALGLTLDDFLLTVGDRVAERAAAVAPKRTGAGAASIYAETKGNEVRVSWDRDHFYMIFHELGSSRLAAHPFLRPALDGQYEV